METVRKCEVGEQKRFKKKTAEQQGRKLILSFLRVFLSLYGKLLQDNVRKTE